MMKFKAIAAAVLVTLSAGAFASTPLSFTLGANGKYSTSFTGSGADNLYTFDLSGFKDFSRVVGFATSFSDSGSGYDISSVSLTQAGGTAVNFSDFSTDFGDGSKSSLYRGIFGLSSAKYTLDVKGTPYDTSKFTGTISFKAVLAPVPEPETYAMLLAGLGLMGAIAKRRKAKQA